MHADPLSPVAVQPSRPSLARRVCFPSPEEGSLRSGQATVPDPTRFS